MRIPKKKRAPKEELEEGETRDSRGFGALEELTSSEVIAQVKMGMSRITTEDEEEDLPESQEPIEEE